MPTRKMRPGQPVELNKLSKKGEQSLSLTNFDETAKHGEAIETETAKRFELAATAAEASDLGWQPLLGGARPLL